MGTTNGIEIVLESANGPKVTVDSGIEMADVEAALDEGWSVDWDSCYDHGDGRQSFPLVRTRPRVLAVTKDGVEIESGEYVVGGKGDDLDWGEVFLDDDGRVMVTWLGSGNGASAIANFPGGDVGELDVYTERKLAKKAFEERWAAEHSSPEAV